MSIPLINLLTPLQSRCHASNFWIIVPRLASMIEAQSYGGMKGKEVDLTLPIYIFGSH